MKCMLFIIAFGCCAMQSRAQITGPEQDCEYALSVCEITNITAGYMGSG